MLPFHVTAGTVALITGAGALLLPKGSGGGTGPQGSFSPCP
jgi:hypothetical protein